VWVLAAIFALVLTAAWVPATATTADGIVEYQLPGGPVTGGVPVAAHGIAAGPDGNMWFTEFTGDKIGRITPAGDIVEFAVPTADSHPKGIAAGPDGNLWFTESYARKIGRITPAGDIAEFPLAGVSQPSEISAGPDGNLWFTRWDAIGRITPTGEITEFPLPVGRTPLGIAGGPDGNLWFTEVDGNRIGRITPAGDITEFPLTDSESHPSEIAAGPDGNMWFTQGNAKIGRITPAGEITEFPLPAPTSARGIATGPDGNIWFTLWDAIGRMSLDGKSTRFLMPGTADPPTRGVPWAIAAGPDGNMWFTEFNKNQIGRITTDAVPTSLKRACPIRVKLHKPVPRTTGSRVLIDRITTKYTCALRKPVARCRPLANAATGKKAACDTKVTKRGKVRVSTKVDKAIRVTVTVRVKAKPDGGDGSWWIQWQSDAWQRSWTLRQPR
jgi:streptogramin lyase